MASIAPVRPYSFTKLLGSSLLGQESRANFERGISEKTATLLGHGPIPNGAVLIPPRAMCRDLFASAATTGGNLIGESVAKVADSVRPQLVLERAGAERIETAAAGISLPRWSTAQAGWIAEGANSPSMSTTVSTVDATARCASARLAFSRKLKLLGQDVESQMLAEIGRSVGNLIEGGFISGSGTNSEPLGLLNLPGKLTATFAGATPTFAELAGMLELLAVVNNDISRLSFVMHPRTMKALMLTAVAGGSVFCIEWQDGQWRCLGVPVYATSNCPEGKVLLADFSAVKLVYFGAAQIVIDGYSNGKSISGATEINILNFADVVVTNESSIAVGSS